MSFKDLNKSFKKVEAWRSCAGLSGEVKSKANSYWLTNNGGLTTGSDLLARIPVLGGDPG